MSEISEKIRTGKLDCNSQELFFEKLVKGLIQDLNYKIKVHSKNVLHYIQHTGDDRIWLMEQDYDYSKEPSENTNTQSVYQSVPRCIVKLGSMDVLPDQLTNPHARGVLEIEDEGQLYTISTEFRRMPVKIAIDLTYILNNFHEVLDLMQYIVTHLSFIQTYKFTYLGQTILVTYRIPDAMEDEHQTELDGTTQDERNPMVSVSLEVESNMPVYENRTAVESRIITTAVNTLSDEKTGEQLDVRLEHGERRLRNP